MLFFHKSFLTKMRRQPHVDSRLLFFMKLKPFICTHTVYTIVQFCVFQVCVCRVHFNFVFRQVTVTTDTLKRFCNVVTFLNGNTKHDWRCFTFFGLIQKHVCTHTHCGICEMIVLFLMSGWLFLLWHHSVISCRRNQQQRSARYFNYHIMHREKIKTSLILFRPPVNKL